MLAFIIPVDLNGHPFHCSINCICIDAYLKILVFNFYCGHNKFENITNFVRNQQRYINGTKSQHYHGQHVRPSGDGSCGQIPQ